MVHADEMRRSEHVKRGQEKTDGNVGSRVRICKGGAGGRRGWAEKRTRVPVLYSLDGDLGRY